MTILLLVVIVAAWIDLRLLAHRTRRTLFFRLNEQSRELSDVRQLAQQTHMHAKHPSPLQGPVK